MRNKVITSILTLAGVLLATLPMLQRRARPSGWQRVAQWFTQALNSLTGRGNTLGQMVRRKIRV